MSSFHDPNADEERTAARSFLAEMESAISYGCSWLPWKGLLACRSMRRQTFSEQATAMAP